MSGTQARHCPVTRKAKYSKMGALFALVEIQRIGDPKHQEKRSYYCEFCKFYHLTKKDKVG